MEQRAEEIAGGSGLEGQPAPEPLPPPGPEAEAGDAPRRIAAGPSSESAPIRRLTRADLAPQAAPPPAAVVAEEPVYPDLSKGHGYERPRGLFRSAVMKTGELIAMTEKKVADGWKRAKGSALAFSGGFSWKTRKDGEPEVVRRWTARIEKKPRSRKRLALACALLLALGAVGVWYATRPVDSDGKREPLF